MKKLFALFTALAIVSVLTLPASAASFLVDPAPQTTSPGSTLAVIVPFNPGDDTIYSVQLELSYPMQLLQGTSFTLNPDSPHALRLLDKTSYTTIDQERGVMRYTIGFPGGLREPLILGTANFAVTSEGVGIIAISPSSQALDQNGNNVNEPFLSTKTIRSGSTAISPEQSSFAPSLPATSMTTAAPFIALASTPTYSVNTAETRDEVSASESTASVALSTEQRSGQTDISTTTGAAADTNLQASIASVAEGGSRNTVLLFILIVLVIASIASALFGLFKRT